MKGIRIALFLLIVACSAEAADGTTADNLSEIMKRGRIVIATISAYPPQSDLVKGVKRGSETKCLSNEYVSEELTGFDTDVAKETAKRLGVEACFVTPEWGEIVSGRWADKWDIAFASVSITSERLDSLYFARPYYSEPAALFVHKDNTSFKHPADLSGKKIGVCSGCIYEYYLDGTLTLPGQKIEYLIKHPEILAYDKQIHSIRELALGDGVKTDAFLGSAFICNSAVSDGLPIKQLGVPVFYTYISPAIDRKQGKYPILFIKKVNEIINQLHNDGTLLKLSQKYYKISTDITYPAKKFDIEALGQYQ